MSTAPAPTNPLSGVTREIGNIVKQFHAEAALVLAVLSGMGVTPDSNKTTTAILAGYAAIAKVAEAFAKPTPPAA